MSYIFKRIMLMLLVMWGVATIVFFISHVIPADPVAAILGDNAPQEVVDQTRAELGLDKPLTVQYVVYMKDLLRGDLGTSYVSKKPIIEDIATYFPATLELTIFAMIFTIVLGVKSGIVSAVNRNKPSDHCFRIISILGVSLPIFWLGLILLSTLYFRLGWFPGGGRCGLFFDTPDITGLLVVDSILTGDWALLRDALWHLILPAFCLGYSAAATVARIMRASMLDVMHQNYIRTAKAKGLAKNVVIHRHAVRNALIPTITVLGVTCGSLLGGAVLTETIFSWPGLGRYLVHALLMLDYPAVTGCTLVIALIYSIANLLVDISYSILDPRMKL